jgi:hypothetical protein
MLTGVCHLSTGLMALLCRPATQSQRDPRYRQCCVMLKHVLCLWHVLAVALAKQYVLTSAVCSLVSATLSQDGYEDRIVPLEIFVDTDKYPMYSTTTEDDGRGYVP